MGLLGVLAGITAASIWGGMYVVSKVVLDIIPPFTLLSLRLILGIICLLGILALQKRWSLTRSHIAKSIMVGLIGYGISLGFQFTGTRLSTAANAALVTSASPVFILIFGVWLLRERVTMLRLLALILASAGVVAVVDPRSILLGNEEVVGNLILIGAAVTWGLYSVLVKILTREGSTIEVSLYAFIGGLPISMTAAGFERDQILWQAIDGPVILGVLYLGIISTALAMVLWNSALARLEAGIVSLLFFAQPIVGASLGAIFLGESLDLGFWIGAVFIGTGLIIAAREQLIVARSKKLSHQQGS